MARSGDISSPDWVEKSPEFITEVAGKRGQDPETCFRYEVKADGLEDLQITTEDKRVQFSPAKHPQWLFLFILLWNRCNLEPLDLADDTQSDEDWPEPESPSFDISTGDNKPVDLESDSRAVRLVVRLAQRLGALLLAQQRGGEYNGIASD
jgi:hypothetical protein